MQYVIRGSSSKKVKEYNSMFTEYSSQFPNFCVGVSELFSRYPEKGFEIDAEVDQIWYVERGNGKIGIHEEVFDVNESDVINIPKATKFFIEGELKLVVISSPPWTEHQHKHLES